VRIVTTNHWGYNNFPKLLYALFNASKIAKIIKVFLHTCHMKGFSPVRSLWYVCKLQTYKNTSRIHTSRVTLLLVFKLDTREKVLPQTSNLNGFSNVCTFWWVFKSDSREKVLSQTSYLNSFSPICTLWCRFKCDAWEKVL
jgi:hypothetical protein